MPTTDHRADQARANGAKSAGPKTPEGKARIAASNRRRAQRDAIIRLFVPPHSTCLCTEDRDPFYNLLDSNLAKYRPVDQVEFAVVRELVTYSWRLDRLAIIETGIWNREVVRQGPLTKSADPKLIPFDCVINAADGLAENDRTLRRIARERAECVRLIAAAERRLVRLRRHFPGQGITTLTSAEERERFCFDYPKDDDPKPTEATENTEEELENQPTPEPPATGEETPKERSDESSEETSDEIDEETDEFEAYRHLFNSPTLESDEEIDDMEEEIEEADDALPEQEAA